MVPGIGVALIGAQRPLEKLEGSNEDQAIGIKPRSRAIEEPLRQIVANAGEDCWPTSRKAGYNAATGEYGDMGGMGMSKGDATLFGRGSRTLRGFLFAGMLAVTMRTSCGLSR